MSQSDLTVCQFSYLPDQFYICIILAQLLGLIFIIYKMHSLLSLRSVSFSMSGVSFHMSYFNKDKIFSILLFYQVWLLYL